MALGGPSPFSLSGRHRRPPWTGTMGWAYCGKSARQAVSVHCHWHCPNTANSIQAPRAWAGGSDHYPPHIGRTNCTSRGRFVAADHLPKGICWEGMSADAPSHPIRTSSRPPAEGMSAPLLDCEPTFVDREAAKRPPPLSAQRLLSRLRALHCGCQGKNERGAHAQIGCCSRPLRLALPPKDSVMIPCRPG